LAVWQLEADAALIDVSHLKCFFRLICIFYLVLYGDWIGFLLEQLVEIGDRRWKIGDRGSGRSVLVKIFSPLFTLSSGSLDLDPSSGATEPYQTEPNRLTFNSRLITVQQTVFRLLPAVFGMVWYGKVCSGLAGSSSTCAVS